MAKHLLATVRITLEDNDLRSAEQVKEALEAVIEVGAESAPHDIVPFSIDVAKIEEVWQEKMHLLPIEDKKRFFIAALDKAADGLSDASYLWSGDFSDLLHSSEKILAAYPLTMSFDEWVHEWWNFCDVVKAELV